MIAPFVPPDVFFEYVDSAVGDRFDKICVFNWCVCRIEAQRILGQLLDVANCSMCTASFIADVAVVTVPVALNSFKNHFFDESRSCEAYE